MDQENTLQITKSRCPQLSGGVFPKPGQDLAEVLKQWLRSEVAPRSDEQPPSEAAQLLEQPQADVWSSGREQSQTSKVPDELASIWKRMCHPRGVVKEFEDLRSEVERLAGSPGLAEYWRILREHGVEHPKRFKSSQPARLFFSAWLARPPRDCR